MNDYHDALTSAHIGKRGLVVEVEHPRAGPIRLVDPPWKTSFPHPQLKAPPILGIDRRDVFRDWLEIEAESLPGAKGTH